MRKVLLAILATIAVMAVVPASAHNDPTCRHHDHDAASGKVICRG